MTGSKTSFYKWIDDIKKAYRHKTELDEKLQFYETRLIGYNAVTYDSIGSSSTKNNVEENLLYVIGKIDEVKKKLKRAEETIKEYICFKDKLEQQEVEIIEYFIFSSLKKNEIIRKLPFSRTKFYNIIYKIGEKYLIFSIKKNKECSE